MPADGLPSLRFERRKELRAVDMQLRSIEGADEMRALASGVPGGAGGELALLQQHKLRPAFQRQMI